MKRRVLARLDAELDANGELLRRHTEANDTLRLLCYPPVDEATGNRCKEHTDYGSTAPFLRVGRWCLWAGGSVKRLPRKAIFVSR